MPTSLTSTAACPRALVVMGVSGCGKSTLMATLAARLACPGLEGDDFHSAANIAKMRSGTPLSDDDRWPWLDQVGTAVGEAARARGIAVIACSALKRSYRDRLRAAAGLPLTFVLLDGEQAVIAARIAARAHHYMPASLLDSQFAALERPGADEQALTLRCFDSVDTMCDAVLRHTGLTVAA